MRHTQQTVKSNRTFLAAFFLLTTIGVSALAYRQYLQLIQLRAKLGDSNGGLEKQLADDEKLIRSLRAQLAAAGRRRSSGALAADDSGSPGPDGPPAAGDRRGNRGEAMRALFNSPQFQALRTLQDKAQLDARYAALFKSLNLTPTQVDQLKNLLVQRQQSAGDAMQAATAAGINPRTDPTAYQQAVADAQADVDKQIQAALGDSAYSQYQQYQQTMPQRTTATQLQTALSYGTTPLTDAQSQQLINLMQTEAAATSAVGTPAGGGGGFGGGGGGPFGGNQAAPVTADTISQAASFLSQPQVQALQQLQQTQQAQQQMQQLMRSGAGGGNRGTAKGG
jgi:hypothetical protein